MSFSHHLYAFDGPFQDTPFDNITTAILQLKSLTGVYWTALFDTILLVVVLLVSFVCCRPCLPMFGRKRSLSRSESDLSNPDLLKKLSETDSDDPDAGSNQNPFRRCWGRFIALHSLPPPIEDDGYPPSPSSSGEDISACCTRPCCGSFWHCVGDLLCRPSKAYDDLQQTTGRASALFLSFEHAVLVVLFVMTFLSLTVLFPLHLTGTLPTTTLASDSTPHQHHDSNSSSSLRQDEEVLTPANDVYSIAKRHDYNYTEEDAWIIRLSIAMIQKDPSRLAVSVVLTYIYVLCFFIVIGLWAHSKFASLFYDMDSHVSSYTVHLTGLPTDIEAFDGLKEEALIRACNDQLFDRENKNSVYGFRICLQSRKREEMEMERFEIEDKLDFFNQKCSKDFDQEGKNSSWVCSLQYLCSCCSSCGCGCLTSCGNKHSDDESYLPLPDDNDDSIQRNDVFLSEETTTSSDFPPGPKCGYVDSKTAITYYEAKKELNHTKVLEWEKEFKDDPKTIGEAFLIFRTIDDMERFGLQNRGRDFHLALPNQTLSFRVYGNAREPSDIIWANVGTNPVWWWIRSICLRVLFVIVFFVLSSPYSIITAVTAQLYKAYQIIDPASFLPLPDVADYGGLLTQYLPSFLLALMSAMVPVIMPLFTKCEKRRSVSSTVNANASRMYFVRVLISLIIPSLVLTGSDGVIEYLLSKNVKNMLQDMFMPGSGAFITNHLVHMMYFALIADLLNLGNVARYVWARVRALTPREIEEAEESSSLFPIGLQFSFDALVFAIVVTYSVFCPIVVPIGFVFFLLRYLITRMNQSQLFSRNVSGLHMAQIDLRAQTKRMRTILFLMCSSVVLFELFMLLFFAKLTYTDSFFFIHLSFIVLLTLLTVVGSILWIFCFYRVDGVCGEMKLDNKGSVFEFSAAPSRMESFSFFGMDGQVVGNSPIEVEEVEEEKEEYDSDERAFFGDEVSENPKRMDVRRRFRRSELGMAYTPPFAFLYHRPESVSMEQLARVKKEYFKSIRLSTRV